MRFWVILKPFDDPRGELFELGLRSRLTSFLKFYTNPLIQGQRQVHQVSVAFNFGDALHELGADIDHQPHRHLVHRRPSPP